MRSGDSSSNYFPENRLTKFAHLIEFKCLLIFVWITLCLPGRDHVRKKIPTCFFSSISVEDVQINTNFYSVFKKNKVMKKL